VMATMEWTISIEGTNEFGDICRRELRIDKSDERLRDGDLGLSIDDGKKIMVALQSAVVNEEAEAYTLFRRVCPDCHNFRPVKDYTTRRIRTVFGTVEVRNPRWPGLPSRDGRRVRAAQGNLPGSGNARADGIDGAAGKLDPVSTGGQRARGILAHRADRDACNRPQAEYTKECYGDPKWGSNPDALYQKPKPFTWTANPDEIIAAVKRGHQVLDSIH
jgi:hypothetical protein